MDIIQSIKRDGGTNSRFCGGTHCNYVIRDDDRAICRHLCKSDFARNRIFPYHVETIGRVDGDAWMIAFRWTRYRDQLIVEQHDIGICSGRTIAWMQQRIEARVEDFHRAETSVLPDYLDNSIARDGNRRPRRDCGIERQPRIADEHGAIGRKHLIVDFPVRTVAQVNPCDVNIACGIGDRRCLIRHKLTGCQGQKFGDIRRVQRIRSVTHKLLAV